MLNRSTGIFYSDFSISCVMDKKQFVVDHLLYTNLGSLDDGQIINSVESCTHFWSQTFERNRITNNLTLACSSSSKSKGFPPKRFFSYSKNYVENGKCERLWNHLSRQVVIIMAVVTRYGKKIVSDKGNSMWATLLVATLYYEMPEAFVTSSLPKWSKSP